jgi:ATP-dependent DNA helicase RecG
MTATPIPRTLALAMNADLDQTVIDELPPGRKPVRTLWLGPHERERAYQFLRHRVTQGQQAYVVCPLIEESEAVSARAAVPEHERLATQVFPDLRVGLLHGRLRPAEKEAVMAAFYAGQLDILVSTSVIEVGVDVPNATVMLIEGADRFGLAQLHQFRGRVGRGSAESVCLLTAEQASPAAAQRLQALAETADGLALAELDLRMRGPGDYFGVRQSGEFDGFRFAREAKPEVLALAQRAATTLLDTDPALAGPTLAGLRAAVEAFSIGVARV